MMFMLVLLGGAAGIELCTHIAGRISPILRSTLAYLAIVSGLVASAGIFAVHPNVFSALVGLFGLYRVFSIARIIKRRMHEHYLRWATWRSTVVLLILQILALGSWYIWNNWHTTGHIAWASLTVLQVLAAAMLLISILRTLRRTIWPAQATAYSDADLPSITVAIPARNETEDLQQCLQSLITSTYPKLEIIVLDDCSQTRRTPEIIRGFAHDGVRFIQGETPSDSWLPKNQAYDRLAQEASGAYILFCGVDIRFAPESLRSIVSTMLDREKQMLSILPERKQEAYGNFSLIQAMRYWWELAPPRRQLRRPPVISSCWVISTKALADAGGFASVKRAIVPEAHFAKTLLGKDAYSFLRSTVALGVQSNKPVDEQRRTAIRMRYPQLHKRPEQVAIAAALEATFLVMPFALAVAGPWLPIGGIAHAASIAASVLLVITYELSVISTKVNNWWFGLIAEPLAVLTDLYLIHYSMWKYEFSDVDWKGRNVCVPVMHVTPTLLRQ